MEIRTKKFENYFRDEFSIWGRDRARILKFGIRVADGMWDRCIQGFLDIRTLSALKVLKNPTFCI